MRTAAANWKDKNGKAPELVSTDKASTTLVEFKQTNQ
jgi:hypothetical protein